MGMRRQYADIASLRTCTPAATSNDRTLALSFPKISTVSSLDYSVASSCDNGVTGWTASAQFVVPQTQLLEPLPFHVVSVCISKRIYPPDWLPDQNIHCMLVSSLDHP